MEKTLIRKMIKWLAWLENNYIKIQVKANQNMKVKILWFILQCCEQLLIYLLVFYPMIADLINFILMKITYYLFAYKVLTANNKDNVTTYLEFIKYVGALLWLIIFFFYKLYSNRGNRRFKYYHYLSCMDI